METMHDVAQAALAQIPPECRLREADGAIIAKHRDLLLALEPAVIKGFYDTLYHHPATNAVFRPSERPDREVTLSQWWRRTVNGPLDEHYFAWMAMVGLVHVARAVSNPMMLTMAQFVSSFVVAKVGESKIPATDAEQLAEAFRRLASTVGAIISFGYDRAYDRAVVTALFEVAGMPESLFQRIRDQEVSAALARARRDPTAQ